jgi:hypothetical protein
MIQETRTFSHLNKYNAIQTLTDDLRGCMECELYSTGRCPHLPVQEFKKKKKQLNREESKAKRG